jgi:hypothetical protein
MDNILEAQTLTEGQIGSPEPEVDPLLLNVTDTELIAEINSRLENCSTAMQELRKNQQLGNSYYEGEQLGKFHMENWELKAVENRIYLSVETLIPLVTANAGDPDIRVLKIPPGMEDMAYDYADTLTCMCLYDYDVTLAIKDTIRLVVRDWYTSLIGVSKYRFDRSSGQVVFEWIDPQNVFLPGPGMAKGWVAEYIKTTLKDLLVEFPDAKEKLRSKFWKKDEEIPEEVLGTEVGYYAYWRNSFCAFKLDDIILDKKLNPYWDWDGEQVKVGDTKKMLQDGSVVIEPVVETYKYRVLDRPRHPYFFFNYIRKSNLDYDRTGSVFQAIPLQDMVNQRKRQIHRVSADTGIIIASGDAIDEGEFRKWDGSPNSTFWAKGGVDITRAFHRLPGAEVSSSSLTDLSDSRQAIDNIFGTQNVTRGQANSSTESGVARQILREADLSRVGPIAEAVENWLQGVYMYGIQMRMLFTTTEYDFPNPNPTETGDYQNKVFDRRSVPMIKVKETVVIDGEERVEEYMKPLPITLRVRRNSTLPKDAVSEYQRAIELLKTGLIDPLTAMEMMGVNNPSSKLARLLKYQLSPMSLLPKDKQAELQSMSGAVPVTEEMPPEETDPSLQ